MSFESLGIMLLVAQVIGIPSAVTALTLCGLYVTRGAAVGALRAACLITAASLLTQAVVFVQFRYMSPDVSLKWYLVPIILGEGIAVGLAGFVAFDSVLRYFTLAVSALAPAMLMCIRTVER